MSNGARQGGILSPYLFNLYINELYYKLSSCNVGCSFNGEMINNIAYADDMSLLSPSPKGLQKLIDIWKSMEKSTTSYLILKEYVHVFYRKNSEN